MGINFNLFPTQYNSCIFGEYERLHQLFEIKLTLNFSFEIRILDHNLKLKSSVFLNSHVVSAI